MVGTMQLHRVRSIVDSIGARLVLMGRQIQKRLVVGVERLGRQRLKRLSELRLDLFVGLQPLRMHEAIALEIGLQTRDPGAAGQPSDQGADGEADTQNAEEEYRVSSHRARYV